MTDTPNLGLPFIEGGQAQKHVTHNEALRILDAAIQIAVLDLTRTAPPPSPAEGERHVVASGASGAWAGQGNAIATWQDGAWAFLTPRTGWCIWSVADAIVFVFDGAHWRDLRDLPVTLDNATHVGINTTASSPNLLSVKSNAALLSAIAVANGGSGDARLQISKESALKTASVVFSDAFSGRAEFGLVGTDAFKLKVSADGSAWIDAFSIDQSSGNLALPRGLALTGVIAPAQITSNQNDYNPAGAAAASVLQVSSDASRSISGLAGGAEGRIISVINVGGQPVALLDESAASTAANRFTLGGDLVISAKQAAMLRYDGTAARWQTMARPAVPGTLLAASNLSDVAVRITARDNLSVRGADIASASTINLEAATGNLVDVTGTTTITAITLGDGHERAVRFTAALTLTNGASLVLPGGASIVTAAGDFAVFRGYASGVVRCASYTPAAKTDARNLIGATGNLVALTVLTSSATWTRAAATRSVVVELKGGGGGGGGVGAATGYLSGAGGGEGGVAIKRITSPGVTETVTVGAGGAAGANTGGNGGAGGTSSFGAWCSASGGAGGAGNTGSSVVQPGGAGGIGSGGDHNRRGGPGMLNSAFAAGTLAVSGQGGGQGGGASVFSSFPGNPGANGGGGSGASSAQFAGNAAAAGGAGGDGYVMVWEYA
ncbi:DUF2793 domain-containing protein [uncultured Bradyrhizobium sp.]|uniref:DUF2793 domain-containing protein n=1 Tax=uncultured Bradyrhizobium sp. TaxID=199684 RepID=UPI0035CC199F